MAGKSKMAMSSDFLDAFARLPRAQQRGVRSLIAKFNVDSTASGLNYERIQVSRDPAMRSLRIDQGYRAIVLKPEHGDIHMLLWADKHDAAYTWATRHECRINSETGALQVYEPRAHSSGEASRRQVEAPEVSTAQPASVSRAAGPGAGPARCPICHAGRGARRAGRHGSGLHADSPTRGSV